MNRADTIFDIINSNAGEMRVAEIHRELAEREGQSLNDFFSSSIVSSTVRVDNKTREGRGRPKRFNTDTHGTISIASQSLPNKQIKKTESQDVPLVIDKINENVRSELKKAISDLTWQEFESSFLTQVLSALGFTNIEITQSTRDGGKDAICSYERGILNSRAIVSAKHWKSKKIGADEIQRVRGNTDEADTGIIVTSHAFSQEAKKRSYA